MGNAQTFSFYNGNGKRFDIVFCLSAPAFKKILAGTCKGEKLTGSNDNV